MPSRLVPQILRVSHDLIAPFADSRHFVRAGAIPPTYDRVRRAWSESATGARAGRDYVAIDESGDFDHVGAGMQPAFLVGAAVHFDAGNYPRLARLFAPWRHIVFGGEEVKAAAAGSHMRASQEEEFLEQVAAAASAGYCAVTLGVVDKVTHRGGVLMDGPVRKAELRHEFHLALLRRHFEAFAPRTRSLRLHFDQCGLSRPEEDRYSRDVGALLEQLSLGGVHSRVDFLDSLVIEMIQLADLLAGVVRKRFDDPEWTDPDAFDRDIAALGRNYLLADLTVRS